MALDNDKTALRNILIHPKKATVIDTQNEISGSFDHDQDAVLSVDPNTAHVDLHRYWDTATIGQWALKVLSVNGFSKL